MDLGLDINTDIINIKYKVYNEGYQKACIKLKRFCIFSTIYSWYYHTEYHPQLYIYIYIYIYMYIYI